MEYLRNIDQDEKFRKIPLDQHRHPLPPFQFFRADKVVYNENEVVEVGTKDGKFFIVQHESKRLAYYSMKNGKGITLPADVPTEHLWLQDLNGLRYKVPDGIPAENGVRMILVAGDLNGAELRGDAYFEAAIDLEYN